MLKRLKLEKELKQQRAALAALEEQEAAFKTREQDLATALDEAETEEDMQTVNEGIEQLEADVAAAGIEEKKGTITAEIDRIEGELSELDERAKKTKSNPAEKRKERGESDMTTNKYQTRELLRTGEYYERAEVKEFYEKLKNVRAVTGGELTIPQVIMNRIFDIMGDYTTLYPLVDKIRVSGTTRILIDTDTTAATWIEQGAAIPSGDVGTITNIDFDGYKVGKVVFVDNVLMQDSIINVDEYVAKKIARALAKALDTAIAKGEGSTKKQPEGILPKLSASHKVTVTADNNLLKNLVKQIGLIDDGTDSVGEIVAVMKRGTYYNRLLGYTINVDSNGNLVGKIPNLNHPDLLGLRIVFNNNLDTDTVLFGDFEKYTLVERESLTIDASDQVKFVEDQTAFRGKGRFDGKPTNADAFALVTITDPVVPEESKGQGQEEGE